MNFIGVDYGAKTSGLTRIAKMNEQELIVHAIDKNKDADHLLFNFINDNEVQYCFIDAPLSLPGVYKNKNGYDNFFFRECDKELRAMSPMFLGGLTARAMKLKSDFGTKCNFIEVYPKMSARTLRLDHYFEFDFNACLKKIESKFEIAIMCQKLDIHSIDAVLAWQTGKRYFEDDARVAGKKDEGWIYY